MTQLQATNDRLKSGAMIRHFLYSLQTRIYLRFVPWDSSKERRCEFDMADLEKSLKGQPEKQRAVEVFLDKIGFHKKDTPKLIKNLLEKYRDSLDGAAHPESDLLNYLTNWEQFEKLLDEMEVPKIHRTEFKELGEMYFKIRDEDI